MKLLTLFMALCLIAINAISSTAIADEMDNYRISADDQISVTVFNETDLGVDKIRVSGNGKV